MRWQLEQSGNIVEAVRHNDLHGRQAYLEMIHTIKPSADFVIDGSQSVAEIGSLIAEKG